MKKKSRLIFSVYPLSVLVVSFFLFSFSLDFVLPLDLVGSRLTPGFSVNTVGNVMLSTLFCKTFFHRLALRYPSHAEEMKEVWKLFVSLRKRNKEKMTKLGISAKTAVMHFLEGEPEAEQINREWLNGLRWCRYGFIGLVAHLPLLLVFSKWVEVVRESIWSYFHIFGR